MQKLKTGLIGCGKVGHIFAACLKAMPESELVGVCGRDLGKTKDFGEKYGAAAFDDPAKMIRETGVEAVCIATPHPQHAVPAVTCLKAKVPVLIEKALAASLEDCDKMLNASRETGTILSTISQRRWYNCSQRVRKAIDEGRLGKPILGVATMYGWRDEKYYKSDPWRGSWKGEGGGILVNQAPHQLDLLLWYMGPIAELSGYWANLNHPYIEVEDTAVASIRFKSGALGQVLMTNSAQPALYGRVQINGSNGASVGVKTDGGAMFIAGMSKIAEPPVNDLWTIPGEEGKLAEWVKQDTEEFNAMDPIAHFHTTQIRDFLTAVRERRQPAVTGEDGRRVVELFTAIYRSNERKMPIQFPLNS